MRLRATSARVTGHGQPSLIQRAIRILTDGTQGWWYDPSDTSTLFQDVAGTIPVTAVGQSVALMLDKSGMGNHATQATSTSRPILRNRYNLFTKSEDVADAEWNVNTGTSIGESITTPAGSSAKLLIATSAAGSHFRGRTFTVNAARYKMTWRVKQGGYSWIFLQCGNSTNRGNAWFNLATGTVGNVTSAGAGAATATIEDAGDGFWECSITALQSAGLISFYGGPATGNGVSSFAGDGTSGIYVWSVDFRVEADASLPYQRVNTATDYDSDTSKFPLYLDADGSDDGMATAAFAAGSDKLTAFAAVHKRSDAAAGMFIELGPSSTTTAGTFGLAIPANAGATLDVYLRGDTGVAGSRVSGLTAPLSLVTTLSLNIAGALRTDEIVIRNNGAVAATTAAFGGPAGGGNFGTYPLYLFRRAGTSLPFNGRFYGCAGKFRALSGAEISTVEQYLRMKSRAY